MMFEMYAHMTDRSFLVVKSDKVNDLLNETMQFIIYNTQHKTREGIVSFTNLKRNGYEVSIDNEVIGLFEKKQLSMGIPVKLQGQAQALLTLKPVEFSKDSLPTYDLDLDVQLSGYENVKLSFKPTKLDGQTHYRIIVKNALYTRHYDVIEPSLILTVDRELEHEISVIVVSPNGLYKAKTQKLKKLQKHFSYQLNESKKNKVTYHNAELIFDGHLWMFYGDKDKKEIIVNIDVQQTFNKEDVFQFEVSSMNDGSCYDLYVHYNNGEISKIHHSSEPGLFEIKAVDLKDFEVDSIEVILHSTRGLGFSIKRCTWLTFSNESVKTLFLLKNKKPHEKNELYYIKETLDTTICEYIDIYVEGLKKGAELNVYLNGKEVLMPIEEKYPEKKYRHMNGVYRFKSNKEKVTEVVIASTIEHMKVYAIRLTDDLQYPKYAEFRGCKEDDYEKNK